MADELEAVASSTEPHPTAFQPPPLVEQMLVSFRLAPTKLCSELLWFAAWRSLRKSEYQNEISCSGSFFAALALPEEIDAGHLSFGDPENANELSSLRRLCSYVESKLAGNDLFVLGAEHYQDIPQFTPRPPTDVSKVFPTDTLREALALVSPPSTATAFAQLDIRTLLRAVLSNENTALRKRLQAVKLDPDLLIGAMSDNEEPRGLRSYNDRDLRPFVDRDPNNPGELSLGIDVYAAALANILRTARGEFCFGLFGQWGSGKTRLARHLEPLLKYPNKYQEAMRARGYTVGSDPDDKLRYEVVWYSAWKFRRPPEAWIFLYEAMAAQYMRAGFFQRLGYIIRTGVARNGYWPLVSGLLALGLIALPIDSWVRLAVLVIGMVGLGGIVYGFGLIRRSRETVQSLASRYAMLTRHGERLGIQALIGDDLRALTLGWIPVTRDFDVTEDGMLKVTQKNVFADRPWYAALVVLGAFATAWLWALLSRPKLPEAMSELVDLCGIVVAQQGFWCAKDAADSTNWSIYLTIFTVWLIVSILVLRAIHLGGNGGNSANRILLVVDDLDRCSPAEVIEIAESLKLLLEDSEIQKRVQILMLVDEEILEHATALKFQALIEDREKQSRLRKEYARDDVVREHIEKLFACHLRLPPLNDAEIGELARLYSQVDVQRWRAARAEEIKKQIERLGQAPSPPVQRGAETVFVQERKPSPRFDPKIEISLDKPARIRAESDEAYAGRLERHGQEVAERERVLGELGREQQKLAEATVSARNPVTSGISPQAQLAGSELRFSDEEVSLLEAELAKHMAGKGRRPSPRAIRLFLFKYQLCYLLLHLSRDVAGYDPSGAQPRAILDALGAACFGKGAASASKAHTSRAALDCVVAQVA